MTCRAQSWRNGNRALAYRHSLDGFPAPLPPESAELNPETEVGSADRRFHGLEAGQRRLSFHSAGDMEAATAGVPAFSVAAFLSAKLPLRPQCWWSALGAQRRRGGLGLGLVFPASQRSLREDLAGRWRAVGRGIFPAGARRRRGGVVRWTDLKRAPTRNVGNKGATPLHPPGQGSIRRPATCADATARSTPGCHAGHRLPRLSPMWQSPGGAGGEERTQRRWTLPRLQRIPEMPPRREHLRSVLALPKWGR